MDGVPWRYRLRHWLALRLPRWLAILLAIRRTSPDWRQDWPWRSYEVEEDTGGGGWYRPTHRRQDPSVDPQEPNGSESSSRGNDHGWSNCTMTSGAMALDFHTLGALEKWGGHLRHRQGDLDGGTDLYDLRDAWAEYGETLTIRSGRGWSGLREDRADGRAIVIQGTGNVPGSATFDGGHACVILPESQEDGDWVWGDPLASGWQGVTESSIRTWAERWSSGIAYAITAAHPPSAPPDPEPPDPDPGPPPVPAVPVPGYPDGYQAGVRDGQARALDAVFGSWRPGLPPVPLAWWDAAAWDGQAWPTVPIPLAALAGARTPAAWGVPATTWTGATWRGAAPPVDPTAWDRDPWSAPWT